MAKDIIHDAVKNALIKSLPLLLEGMGGRLRMIRTRLGIRANRAATSASHLGHFYLSVYLSLAKDLALLRISGLQTADSREGMTSKKPVWP